MQCEKCQERNATVHVKRKVDSGENQPTEAWLEHHLCEECFRATPELNPGYAPMMVDERCSGDNSHFSYAWGHGHRAETVRVMSTSAHQMVLRVVRSDTDKGPEDWLFLRERMPGPWRKWPVGKEVQLSLSESAFEWLQGKRETYDDWPGL
jgi:hypothetical protein